MSWDTVSSYRQPCLLETQYMEYALSLPHIFDGTNQLEIKIQPSLDTVKEILVGFKGSAQAPNIVPICASIPADLLTPSLAFLKISAQSVNGLKRAQHTC